MSTLSTWRTFLNHSLAARLDVSDFESYVEILASQHPLPASRASDIFLGPTESNSTSLDPRIPRYVQILLALDLVTVPSLLTSLLRYSTASGTADVIHSLDDGREGEGKDGEAQGRKKDGVKRWSDSYAAEEVLFYRLAKHVSSGTSPNNVQEAVALILICMKWMVVVLNAHNAAQDVLELSGSHVTELNAQIMALGTLVVAVVENPEVLNALSKGRVPKGTGKELSKTLGNLIAILLQSNSQSLSAARLEVFRTQTLVTIEPVDKKELSANKEIDDILDGGIGLGIDSVVVEDLPTLNSRAGLYIYLNALVSTYT